MLTERVSKKTRRGRPRRAGLDDEILAATNRLVAERGYAGATLDDVARAVGVAKTTLYRRWPSKGELGVDALAGALGTPPTDLSPGADGLREAIDWLVARVRTKPIQRLLVGLVAAAADDPELRARMRTRLRDPFTAPVTEEWGLSPADVDMAFDLVLGTLLHRLAMTGRITAADADAVGALAANLLFGTSNEWNER